MDALPTRIALGVAHGFAIVFLAASCGGGDGPTGATGPKTVSIQLSGAGVSDTIGAEVPPLTIRVVEDGGTPRSGSQVQVLLAASVAPLLLGAGNSEPTGSAVTVTTGQTGTATVRVRFGTFTGAAKLLISGEGGATAEANYQVLPGNPVSIGAMPGDTGVFNGNMLNLAAVVRDRANNVNPVAVSYATSAPHVAHVNSSTGAVAAQAEGETTISASVGNLVAQTVVTVFPMRDIVAAHVNGSQTVYLMKTDGSGRQLVMSGSGGYPWFSWSPDGSRLIAGTGTSGLSPYLYELLPGPPHRILPTDAVIPREQTYPRYSADGQWVYFSGGVGYQSLSLARMRPDGSDPEILGPVVDYQSFTYGDPSPDGLTLALVTDPAGLTTSIIQLMDIESGVITDLGVLGIVPRWSPEGLRIAFVAKIPGWGYLDPGSNVTDCGPCDPLMVMKPDGSEQQQIAPAYRFSPAFDWSPDGKYIIGRVDPTPNYPQPSLAIVAVATGRIIRIPDTHEFRLPAWKPW